MHCVTNICGNVHLCQKLNKLILNHKLGRAKYHEGVHVRKHNDLKKALETKEVLENQIKKVEWS